MIREHRFNTWSDFKSLVCERLSFGGLHIRGNFLFRGQEDSEWKLVSSFDREFNNNIDYDTLLENFKKEYGHIPNIQENIISNDETGHKVQALGQHYGLPTRLIDWTESPYIASFFAYQAALRNLPGETLQTIRAENKSVAIWALDTRGFWKEYIVRPSQEENKRLFNQLGCFTVTPTTKDGRVCPSLEDFVENNVEDNGSVLLWKFIIPLREVVVAMEDLSLMGINATSLMGDHEGRARAAINRTILESL